ncbi:MAG: RIP metalloprotease RseP [Bryobacteraceae bacterium]
MNLFSHFWQTSFVQDIWWVLVLLGVMIVVHELGHYWAAIAVGIRVETFSIGFGPRLFGWRRGATDFRVSAVPFGGYVRMLGELPGDDRAADPESFQSKARWQRAMVVFAGPLMNILLAFAIMTGVFMREFPKQESVQSPVIGEIVPHSPAAQAGLQAGDRIVQIAGIANPTWQDIQSKEALNAGRPLQVVVERNGERLPVIVTPTPTKDGVGMAGWLVEADVVISEVDPHLNAYKAGLKPGDVLISANGQQLRSMSKLLSVIQGSKGTPISLVVSRNQKLLHVVVTPENNAATHGQWLIGVLAGPKLRLVSLPLNQALVESVRYNVSNGSLIFEALRSIVEQKLSPRTLSGPIGIARLSGEAASAGPIVFFSLMAEVSINLAIFNMLPIPILDGGSLLMLIIEMVIRRDMSLQVKEAVFKVGFVFLMMIVVFVLYNDISKMFSNG